MPNEHLFTHKEQEHVLQKIANPYSNTLPYDLHYPDDDWEERVKETSRLRREKRRTEILSKIKGNKRNSSEQSKQIDFVLWSSLLNSKEHVSYNKTIAKHTSIEESVLLGYFFQYKIRAILKYKWICFSSDDIESKTCLTQYQIRTTLQKWIGMGLIYNMRSGIPPLTWYLFDIEEINVYLCKIFEYTKQDDGTYRQEADGKIRFKNKEHKLKAKKAKGKKQYPDEWNEKLKEKIRRRDNYQCQNTKTKKHTSVLHVHHIDYDKSNCKDRNLITLCKECHSRVKGNKSAWKQFYTNIMKEKGYV